MRLYLSLSSALLVTTSLSFASAPAAPVAVTPAPPVAPVATAIVAAPVATHASAASDCHTSLNRFVLATSVQHKEPVDVKENFTTLDGHIVAFADLNNHKGDHVTFQWKHEGHEYLSYKAKLGNSPHWRTSSHITARPGHWTVSVIAENGQVLKEAAFSVEDKGHVPAHAHAAHVAHPTKTSTPAVAETPKPATPSGIQEVLQSLQPEKPAAAVPAAPATPAAPAIVPAAPAKLPDHK
ncbi:MAG: DUF2914 domain-containing protein [Alphaproteobacteria bacterium]|nr:DUF2914 domain-containing protein [Alphaproteobacteria bacterium]